MSESFHKEIKCGSDFSPSSPRPPHPPLWASDGEKSLPLKITFLIVCNHSFGNACYPSLNFLFFCLKLRTWTMIKNSKQNWFLIIDKSPLPGSLNMAVDDYLFRNLDENPQTFVRFYRWERPTVSLGYSQRIHRVADIDFCQQNGIDIVRRMTGGKLVLHHKEVTYSICSSDSQTFPPTVGESYKLVSEALMRGLEKMGLKAYLADSPPDFYARGNLPCFSYPARNEIELMGKKIIGSAQKRIG